jgi:hypothetical protein
LENRVRATSPILGSQDKENAANPRAGSMSNSLFRVGKNERAEIGACAFRQPPAFSG